jgi:predicted molibdopterin-dependent oxidoreductase YjgC
MSDSITLTIDDRIITTVPGTTILDAAQESGIEIAHVCFHEALTPPAVCRVCVVEVEGARVLQAACVAQCAEGQVIHTRNERVERSRRTILEMLHSAVRLDEAPEVLTLIDDYKVSIDRFGECEQRDHALKDDNPFYMRDYSQCILCWRCVQVCAEDGQFAFALNFGERGFHSHIATFDDLPMPETSCVFCGQCVGVCPTGALKPKAQWGLEQGMDAEGIRAITRRGKKKKS